MYLFTLVFIFLTIIGLFTEVLALQQNRFFARQTTGAAVLATWHGAVVNAAHYTQAGAPVFAAWGTGNTACTLRTAGAPPASLQAPECPDASGAAAAARLEALVVAPGPVTVTTLLPQAFAASFQSVMMTATNGNTRLAVTFINPPANPNDVVPPTGYTLSQLYRQLGRLHLDQGNYGYVVNGQLQPAASLAAGIGNFTIPNGPFPVPQLMNPNGPIQNGALALFSPL